jgi:hypothetical protein
VLPWVQEGNPTAGTPTVYIRGVTTSTLLTCSSNVEPTLLPASSWVGYRKTGQEDRSSVVINGLKNAPPGLREATIGLLGMDLYDRDRAGLDVLAYQAKGQKFGFYPDSSPSKRDKRNVRDGHYVPWGYTEYLTKVDSSHVPTNPQVARILDIVGGQKEVRLVSKAGVTPAFDVDALEVIAPAGLIPDCAMQVTRGFDGGDLSLYSASAPCGCFYETVQDPDVKLDHAFMDRCTACDSDANCDARCRRGYCEAK